MSSPLAMGPGATFAATAMASLCDDLVAANARSDDHLVAATLAQLDEQLEKVGPALRAAFGYPIEPP